MSAEDLCTQVLAPHTGDHSNFTVDFARSAQVDGLIACGPDSGSRLRILDSRVKNNAKLCGIMPSLCDPRTTVFSTDFKRT